MAAAIPLKEIAKRVGAEIIGLADQDISTICSLDEPQPQALSFVKDGSRSTLETTLGESQVSALFVPANHDYRSFKTKSALLPVKDPLAALVSIVSLFIKATEAPPGISAKADIDPSAQIGRNVRIGAFVSIGPNCRIEDEVTILPHVVIYPNVQIGKGSLIHSGAVLREGTRLGADNIIQNGAVIGADGFGYFPSDAKDGAAAKLVKIPQVGTVVLDSGVEIGANTCIDRATLGTTRIGIQSKIDNLVQVGHNTKIGAYSIACGQVGIAGSCKIGNQVILGGSVGVGDHITIADGVRVAGRGGVVDDIPEKGDYAGHPAVRVMAWKKSSYALQKLPDLLKRINKIAPREIKKEDKERD